MSKFIVAGSHQDQVDSRMAKRDYSSSTAAAGHDIVADCGSFRYDMNYACLGTCVIINNKNFISRDLSTRDGTDVDAESARKTFSRLGYNVRVARNQTAQQMKSMMFNVSQEDHSRSASFVCVLLSHGEEGMIYGTDVPVRYEELTKHFKGYRCKSLVGKPKLFFIQACRGSSQDDGVQVDCIEEQRSARIPVEADFLYAYSTAPGYLSLRNTSTGSWFIQALCDMLQRHSGKLELMHIMTRVNRQVALFHKQNQIPCIVSMLTEDFYFPR
eukprot:superscaffoldBa00006283_g21348